MTDNEIIKALECCKDLKCSECPKKANLFVTDCDVKLCDEVLELIKRQQAKIERLEIAFENSQKTSKYWNSKCNELVEEVLTAKSEEIKKFAERLKRQVITIPLCEYEEHGYKAVHYEIDDLVKEMTEVKDDEQGKIG